MDPSSVCAARPCCASFSLRSKMPAPAKHSTLDASGDSVVAVNRRALRITVGRSHRVSRGTDPPVSPEYPQPIRYRHLVSSHTRSHTPSAREILVRALVRQYSVHRWRRSVI
jgi:hypothetical protein